MAMAAAVLEEREACAKIAEGLDSFDYPDCQGAGESIATMIRDRTFWLEREAKLAARKAARKKKLQ